MPARRRTTSTAEAPEPRPDTPEPSGLRDEQGMISATWEQRVRERAYAIWEREGRPEDGAERH